MSMGWFRTCSQFVTILFATAAVIAPVVVNEIGRVGTSAFAVAASYNAYQYDMTVPQFTPDGRLLQVEYASKAADLSAPIVIAPLFARRRGPGVAAETGGEKEGGPAVESNNCEEELVVAIVALRTSRRPGSGSAVVVQERLVVIPDSDCVMALSGVLSDNLALLKKVQEQSLENRRSYGVPLDCRQVASVVCSSCQQHAFGGGIRPYGSTIVVCGRRSSQVTVQQTDPSGALHDLVLVTGNDGASRTTNGGDDRGSPVVVGGRDATPGVRQAIERRLRSEWSSIQQEPLGKGIGRLLALMTEEQEMHERQPESINDEIARVRADDQQSLVEIVLVSSSKGVYKMSAEQLEAIRRKERAGNP